MLYESGLVKDDKPDTRGKRVSGRGKQPMKVREAIRLIQDHGWYLVITKGSHRQFKHAERPGRVTIAGNLSDDLAPGTLNSILKQAGLKEDNR